MTIALEFIDFVVPIALIRQKYPGGWEQCLQDHESLIGGRVWFDEHLLRAADVAHEAAEQEACRERVADPDPGDRARGT